jgi:hypothetical protein
VEVEEVLFLLLCLSKTKKIYRKEDEVILML